MKSILIQQSFEKFLQNCSSMSFNDLILIDIAIGNNLYQTFFKHKPEHCLFSAHTASNETLQFCEDYADSTNIFFFHQDHQSYDKLKNLLPSSRIKHIGYSNCDIILPEPLINDQLFYSVDNNNNNGIVCFMDGLDSIPNDLLDLLYPSTTAPIKLFNCPNIKHYQNLGILTEKDKATVLQTHKYYLDLNQSAPYNYTNEAMACGALPVSMESIRNNTYHSAAPPETKTVQTTYSQFLRDIFQL